MSKDSEKDGKRLKKQQNKKRSLERNSRKMKKDKWIRMKKVRRKEVS